jgi:hypothetical protein
MSIDAPITGGGPLTYAIAAFQWVTGRQDSSAIESANIRAAREAGYTGNRETLIAIGGGIRNAAVFAAGQGGGPGPDRAGPARAVAGNPPFIPAPNIPGLPGSIPPSSPPSVPGRPGGPSIPDRLPGGSVIGEAAGTIVRSILRGGWVGGIFYPSSTSRDDTVCLETDYGPWCPPGLPAVPAPAVPGTRTGRRARPRVVRPGRRARPRVANPVAPPKVQPRGRPVTISRPRVIEQPRVETRAPPAPRSLPPPSSSFPAPGPVARPATIPATSSRVLPALASLVLPAVGVATSLLSGSQTRVGSQANPLTWPRPITLPGTITLPGIGPSPSPLANLAANPLTSFNAVVAQSPAQELDRQCRERAKRKRKKKREPRKVCYRGTYIESSKSTRKTRKEKVPCQ